MRRIVFALAAVVVALAATLGAVELTLRLFNYPPPAFSPWIADRSTGFRFAPNVHERMVRPEYDVLVETNAEGFRDDPVEKKSGFRILLLGDSFASGYGVERGQLFADIVEKRLGVEVVNAGVGGWEIVQQVHFFAERGGSLEPDLVVYALYLANDLTRNGEWIEGKNNSLRSRVRHYPVRVTHGFKLVQLFHSAVYHLRARGAQARGEWRPFPDYLEVCRRRLNATGRRDYSEVRELLGRLRSEVRDAGARLFVVTFPFRTAVEDDARERLAATIPDFSATYDLHRPVREVARILQDLHIDHMDVGGALRRSYRSTGKPLYFRVDGHLNVLGHRVFADALAPALEKKIAPSRGPGR